MMLTEKRKGSFRTCFNAGDRGEVDRDYAMMFYTGGVSFNFTINPFFRHYSKKIANNN